MRDGTRWRRTLAALLVAGLGAGFAAEGSAQEASASTRVWAALGLGAGGGGGIDLGAGALAQVVVQREPHHAALRALVLDGDFGFPLRVGGHDYGEVGLLYGRTRARAGGHVAAAAGVSLVALDTCAGTDDDSCFTLGVPLTVEAARRTTPVGLGVQAFANLNDKASVAGLMVFVQVGRLR